MNDKKGEKNEKSIIINKNNFNERELYQEKITKHNIPKDKEINFKMRNMKFILIIIISKR